MISPVTGQNLGKMADQDPNLAKVVGKGLRYWVLREDVPPEAQRGISQWRNQDQTSNQTFHDIELTHALSLAAKQLSVSCTKVALTNVCAMVQRGAPVRLSGTALMSVGRYVLQFFSADLGFLVHELCQWHSAHVDPQELAVGAATFEVLSGAPEMKGAPYLRQAIMLASYTGENALQRQRPSPNVCNLITATEVHSFCKNAGLVSLAEGWLKTCRERFLGHLEENVDANQARCLLVEFGTALVRLVFAKKLHVDWRLPKGYTTGMATPDKHHSLLVAWLKYVDLVHPSVAIFAKSGFTDPFGASAAAAAAEVFDISPDKVGGGEAKALASSTFTIGDLVQVRKRYSALCPTTANPLHRHDVNVGAEGAIIGFQDDSPLVQIRVIDGGRPVDVVHAYRPEPLVLASAWVEDKGHIHAGSSSTHMPQADTKVAAAAAAPKGLAFLHQGLKEEEKTNVSLVRWSSLAHDMSEPHALHPCTQRKTSLWSTGSRPRPRTSPMTPWRCGRVVNSRPSKSCSSPRRPRSRTVSTRWGSR